MTPFPPGLTLHRVGTVGSSNDVARDLARAGAGAGTVVLAEAQTAGRGRRGHAWESPPGNLYLSLLTPPGGPAAAPLGLVAALALAETLHGAGALAVALKWPNDVLLAGRKVAGVLVEPLESDRAVVGIGVNVRHAPADSRTRWPAVALADRGAEIALDSLAAAFLARFLDWRDRWQQEGFAPVRTAWRPWLWGVGRRVRVGGETPVTGVIRDLSPAGALVLATATGDSAVWGGEVTPEEGIADAVGH